MGKFLYAWDCPALDHGEVPIPVDVALEDTPSGGLSSVA